MKTEILNTILSELENMYRFMDADMYLCNCADMPYNYAERLENNYQIIAKRVGVTVEEVKAVDNENLNTF